MNSRTERVMTTMSNSPLICYTKISPNRTSPRQNTIKKITIHHMAGCLSIETCGNGFASPSRRASSNYGIGNDGRIAMYVEEKDRAWTSSSGANDHQAVTIEVANRATGGNWPISDKAMESLIALCVDICKRNGIPRLNYTGDASGNLTMHKWFAATGCPGPYLESKFPYIAAEVNRRLADSSQTVSYATVNYRAKVNDPTGLNCRSGAGTQYGITKAYPDGTILTITRESGTGWGYTGEGWVNLAYTKKINMEVELEMTKEEFLASLTGEEAYELVNKALIHMSTLPEPDWSKQEGHWAAAEKSGVINGGAPERLMRRDELVAILGRKGLL